MKFIEIQGEISKLAGRSRGIDRQILGMSNRYFQQIYHFIEFSIRLRKLFTFKARGTNPLAIQIDGKMKFYRWLSAQG